MIPFYDKKHSKKYEKIIEDLVNFYNVKVIFTDRGYSSACYWENYILIDLSTVHSIAELLCAVFHELGHLYCYQNDLFAKYHWDLDDSYSMVEIHRYMHKMGLKAERFVDKVGEQLMSAHFPDIPYIGGYNTKTNVKWYKAWLNKNYPLGD